jgi:hypothetical protein
MTNDNDQHTLLMPLVVTGAARIALLDALQRLGHNLGSVDACKVLRDTPPGSRLVCVQLVDEAALVKLARDLKRELADDPLALILSSRCMVARLPLDTVLVVFLDLDTLGPPP